MYILNKFDVMHTIPDDAPLPAGARKATKSEVEEWQAQDAENKAAILAKKQAAALTRAQTVVVGAPEADAPAPSGGAKKGGDDK